MRDDSPTTLSIARLHTDTVSQRTADGLVVVNLRTYEFVELDEIGGAMWEALRATGDLNDAAARLADEYDAPVEEITADLVEFAQGLAATGLAVDDDAGSGDSEHHDRVNGVTDSAADAVGGDDPGARARELYLDLTARAVCGLTAHNAGSGHLGRRVGGLNFDLRDLESVSLIGLPRLHHLRRLVERVIADGVPGDLMECGVWRGGAAIMMRATLVAHGVTDRAVWLADSFQGLPATDPETFPLDDMWQRLEGQLAVSADEVRRNIECFGLLDDSVKFLEGWFADTLPTAPITRLAVLRLDADLQESTLTTLENLYHRVSPGGFVVMDDYCFEPGRAAIDTFRHDKGITAPLHHIDWNAAFWQVPTE